VKGLPKAEIQNLIIELEVEMKETAELLEFERAILLRKKIESLRNRIDTKKSRFFLERRLCLKRRFAKDTK